MSDSTHQTEPLLGNDAELERQLTDALEAPPVPRSLLKRLDQGIAAEWGESPQLVKQRGKHLKAAASRGVRMARSLPVAAAAAVALVVLAVLFTTSSKDYAWAAMLKAMEEQGVVRIEADGKSRWLSLSEGIVSEYTADSSRMLNLQAHTVLERDGEQVLRRKLHTAKSRDQMALAFLLGGDFLERDMARLDGVQLVTEKWQQPTDGEAVALHVTFESQIGEQFHVNLTLDADSHLPENCEVKSAAVTRQFVALTYSNETVVTLSEQQFPADLPRVDVTEAASLTFHDEPSTEIQIAFNDQPALDVKPEGPPLFGAPSKWHPVEELKLSGDETVKKIDALVAELWKQQGITPTKPASDSELLRRVYLDLAGRIPSVNETRSYLEDKSSDRYEKLVDRLLKSPDHASHIATVWRTFLIPEGVDLAAFGGVEAFDKWLAKRLASGDSYDEVVRSLLLARGRLSKSGPLLFYSAVKLDADQLASRTARVFLGMRLECAQCHDHPFEPWTQDDFWGFAAYFARISRPQAELETVSTVLRVSDIDRGEVMLPDTEVVVQPKFLDGRTVAAPARNEARRKQLAAWLTGAENPYFARATANRVWGHLFGKGIVDPIDDFGTQNKPKSPELLELLAGHFISTDFSLRELFRSMVLSKAYRLSSGGPNDKQERGEYFAQMNIKTLTAEQVFDCITVATLPEATVGGDQYNMDVVRFNNSARDQFIAQFRTPAGRTTEYLGGIPQALTLMNGSLIEGATGLASSGLLKSLEAPFFTNDQRLEVLYFATLSREPRPAEKKLLRPYIEESKTPEQTRQHLADILWALLNSAEFTLNH